MQQKTKPFSFPLPRHIAIVMDGNGRWAKQRGLPRVAGHRAGAKSVKKIVKACGECGIEVLTLFAFSKENWLRPQEEVNFLMNLLLKVLAKEIKELHANNVQLRIIGDKQRLPPEICKAIETAEKLTLHNSGLKMVVALNYSGKWDIANSAQKIATQVANGTVSPQDIDEEMIAANMA